jgi:membrane protease subunit (stomatin/prohibitin family)
MGLIKATINATKGTLRDQYKEFIYCDSLPTDVLMRKGKNKLLEGGTNRPNDNIISDGSRVVVNEGQFLLIVENGRIVDFCGEPGEYIWNTGTTPSMLTGGFKGLKESFITLGGRIQAGGQPEHDQRVYYINTKEIMNNKFGAGDIPFRDSEFNFTIKLKCYGTYSYKITDPLMFYKNVAANVNYEFRRNEIDGQFKDEVLKSLKPSLGRVALKRIPYDQLILFTKEISDELNIELSDEWVNRRGISVVSFALSSVTPDAESAKKIEEFQSTRVYTDERMLGAKLGTAQAEAMIKAAENKGGAMMGFMGMGMAQQAGGMNAAQLFQMADQKQQHQQPVQQPVQQPQSVVEEGWSCECGTVNSGKFCMECGSKAPEQVKSVKSNNWFCPSCNTENSGKFCMECGEKKPLVLDAKCESCGFEGSSPFKFCPECGAQNLE